MATTVVAFPSWLTSISTRNDPEPVEDGAVKMVPTTVALGSVPSFVIADEVDPS